MAELPTFGYWNIRGIAQPIKYMLAYLEIPYKEVQYDIGNAEEWYAAKETLGLEFPNIPYWIDGDVKLTEGKAILKYLARKYGSSKLVPGDSSTPYEIAQFEMIESLLFDMWNSFLQYAYFHTDAIVEYFPKTIGFKLQKLSDFLGSNDFLFWNKVTYIDFILGEIIVLISRIDEKLTEPHENLRKLRDRVESLPKVAEYMKSSQYIDKPICAPGFAKVKI